jgi:anti-anti-sigma regulatory factor
LLFNYSGLRLWFGGVFMILIYESAGLLHVTISGECNFSVARELVLTCKARLHQRKIACIKIVLEDITYLDSSAVGAMLLLSDWVDGNLHVYVDNLRQSIFLPFHSTRINLSEVNA